MPTLAAVVSSSESPNLIPSQELLNNIHMIFPDPAQVVGYEKANKGLPDIRRAAEHDQATLLTKGGRATNLTGATLVISLKQMMKALQLAYQAGKGSVGERRRPDAILSELIPIESRGKSIQPSLGLHEETLGGHVRF